MGYVSNQIFMSAIDDGTTIHGSLVANKSLSQGYNKENGTFSPDWSAGAGPTIYLTLLDGATPIAPTGWSAETQNAVKWYWNNTEITFDSEGYSTNAKSGTHSLFQRTTATWNGISMPALKIVYNLALAGALNNDVIRIDGNVEMSGDPIPFSAGVTVQLGEVSSNGYFGGIDFPDGSVILSDDQSIRCVANLYSAGVGVSEYKCVWKFNGTTVTSTNPNDPIYMSSSGTGKTNDILHVSGDDESGVLDIATVTCTFQVKDENDATQWNDVLTITETIDDQGDEQVMYVYYTLGGTSAKINGAPVSLHKGQKVTWDIFIATNIDAEDIKTVKKFEFMPKKANGSAMTSSDFTSESGSPLNVAEKWSDGWCDISKTGSGQAWTRGGFTCCFADIHNAGKNISGIVRATI